MNYYDGGEGSIGEYGYLAIFGVDEILAMNVGDDAYGRFKNIIYFASDRSGMYYAFDKQDGGMCIIGIDEDSFDYSEAYWFCVKI